MDAHQSIIADLETAIQSGSMDERTDILWRVANLFLHYASRLDETHVEVFDDVLSHLVWRIGGPALAKLSDRLGPINNAPVKVVRQLARDDDIAVAEPILTKSARLGTADLIEVSKSKSQAHLLAISGRANLDALVTDLLLSRGNRNVVHRLADNQKARFSASGFKILLDYSNADGELARKVEIRIDLPSKLRGKLSSRAIEAARSRLLSAAGLGSRDCLERALLGVSEIGEVGEALPNDTAEAQRLVLEMHRKGELTESALRTFAKANRQSELTAAIALLCSAPYLLIKHILQSETHDVALIPCRAAGLRWTIVQIILAANGRFNRRAITDQDLNQLRIGYSKLTQRSVQKALRFWQYQTNVLLSGVRGPQAMRTNVEPLGG